MTSRLAPSRHDPIAATTSQFLGGPVGDHAGSHRWWTPARVLLAMTTATLVAGMVSKAACVPSGWSRPHQPLAQLCWSELAGRSVDAQSPPQVVTWLMRLAEALPGSGTVATAAWLAVLLAVAALGAAAALSAVDPHRPWLAAGWALAPVLAVHWLSWELLAAAALAVSLWAWTTGRSWLAGLAAGVGAVFALPVLAALLGMLAVGGRLRERLEAVLAAAAAYVVLTLPGRAQDQAPDVGSIWLLLRDWGVDASATTRTAAHVVALLLAASLVWWVVSRSAAPGGRTVARAGLVMLVVALILAPSAPPELGILALPLAAIALPRWRDLLIWQGLHLLSWVLTGWTVGEALLPTVDGDARAEWLAVVLRVTSLLWLVGAVLLAPSADDDAVERGRGEPHPDVDLLADAGDARP